MQVDHDTTIHPEIQRRCHRLDARLPLSTSGVVPGHIPEEDGEAMEDDAECDDIHLRHDDDQQQGGRVTKVEEAQKIAQNRMAQSSSFYVKARDVVKYMPTPGCPGCKYATSQVNTQCGHSPTCKAMMMDLMAEDRDDRHSVKKWFMEKGIDVDKNGQDDESDDPEANDRAGAPGEVTGPVPHSQRGLSNLGALGRSAPGGSIERPNEVFFFRSDCRLQGRS